MKLTSQQKLAALAYRFYQVASWDPKAGDYYTTSRADFEVYQVVAVEGEVVKTRFTEGSDTISEWPRSGFLTEGFGPKRVFIPAFIFESYPAPVSHVLGLERMADLAEARLMAIHKALDPDAFGVNGIESPEDHVAYMTGVLRAALTTEGQS